MGQQVKDMIVEKLVEQREHNEIVQAVCEQAGVHWQQAEELVRQAESEQAHAVARGQMPMLVFLSAASSGLGILMVAYSVQTLMEALHGEPLAQIVGLADSSYGLWAGVIGLSMIAGGVMGMWKAMLRYFET